MSARRADGAWPEAPPRRSSPQAQATPPPPESRAAAPAGSGVAIFGKPGHPGMREIVPGLVQWLERRGWRALPDPSVAAALDAPLPPPESAPPALAVVLGGDGTMLHAARRLAGSPTPIVAFNLGTLGFLSDTPAANLYPELEAILAGHGHRQVRTLLEAALVRDGARLETFLALNDAVVAKGPFARILHFALAIDGERVALYRGDGIIVATPTGSTAYSFSAGGPVLHPDVDVLVVTPICPHTLNNRPVIVRDSARIAITLEAPAEAGFLTMDGQQGVPLAPGDRVLCGKSALTVTFVSASPRPFFELVRTKLLWG